MHKLIPLLDCKARFQFTGAATVGQEKLQEYLKPFYCIAILDDTGEFNENSTLCKLSLRDPQTVMFNENVQKIGVGGFNIATTLTLDSHSDDIKSELERFYKAYAQRN